jgi:iron complex outermembrane receptor protein
MDTGTGASALRLAIRAALATGAGLGLVASDAAIAQSESGDPSTDDVAVQQKITVTGSRIKRIDFEGPLPITVIDREAIDASGDLTVADVVRRTTYNTFGSWTQRSGGGPGQGVNTVNLRGLGDDKTLVLINGRRMAGAPGWAGEAQNLSVVPLAAVERIEILRDGASAIYGTDAIAGVVNIILRKDYEGVHLSADIARPSQSGGDEDAYSIVGGVTGAKGNVTFALAEQKRDIVFEADRSFTAERLSSLGFPGSYFAYLTTDDPRNPTGVFAPLGTFPDPRCPDEFNIDPDFPNSELWSFGTPDGQGRCQYDYASQGAQEAQNDTKSFFVSANYEITEATSFFAQGLFSHNESFGRYAPVPLNRPLPTLSQDNPNNPTNPANPTNADGLPYAGQEITADIDFDGIPDLTARGPFDLSIFYRNVPTGPRDGNNEDTLLDYVAGLRGTIDWLGGTDWQLAGQYSEQMTDGDGSGNLLRSSVDAAIANGELDVFGVTDTSPGSIEDQAAGVSMTTTYDGRFRIAGGDGQLAFDAFQLDPGPVSMVVGFEYRDEDFDESYDEQSRAGNVAGTFGSFEPLSGARAVKSLFAESVIPLLDSLELDLAARYDDYNDFGTTLNPKASLAFRPLDSLLLRASWGQGFQAPSLYDLYAAPSAFDSSGTIDTWRCSQTPQDTDGDGRANVPQDDLPIGHPCNFNNEFTAVEGGNRDLNPIESSQWSLGFVWSPIDSLTLNVDYYRIEIDNAVALLTYQQKLDEEFRLRGSGETGTRVGDVTRLANGGLVSVENDLVNVAKRDTEGLDLDVGWSLPLGGFGDLTARLYWTHVINYSESDPDDPTQTVHRDGDLYHPEDRGRLTLNWALGDFSATAVGNYVSDQEKGPWYCAPEYGNRCRLGTFKTVDLQASWATPWNGQITIGARNIFDEDPPTTTDLGRRYESGQHSVFGRVPYIRWEQDL